MSDHPKQFFRVYRHNDNETSYVSTFEQVFILTVEADRQGVDTNGWEYALYKLVESGPEAGTYKCAGSYSINASMLRKMFAEQFQSVLDKEFEEQAAVKPARAPGGSTAGFWGNCPCWKTGKYVWVAGCKDHPRESIT